MIRLHVTMTRETTVDMDCDNFGEAVKKFHQMWSSGDVAVQWSDRKWDYEQILFPPKDVEFELVYATRYNGMYLNFRNIKYSYEMTDELQKICDEIADTFPSYTAEWGREEWDHTLTNEQEKKLCEMAFDKVKHLYPEAIIAFEYDEYSS